MKVWGVLGRMSRNNNGNKTCHKQNKETWKTESKQQQEGCLITWRAWTTNKTWWNKTIQKGETFGEKPQISANCINSVSLHESTSAWMLSTRPRHGRFMAYTQCLHGLHPPKKWPSDWFLRRSSPAAGILKPSNIFLILAASAGAEASWQTRRWQSHDAAKRHAIPLNYTATLSCPVLHSFLHSLQLLDVVSVVLTLIGKQIHFLWPSKAPKRFVLNLGSISRLNYLVDHQ